jgi:hypothetical protein
MPGQGNKIRAADYNIIQYWAERILGTGDGQYGYGQNVLSNQVSTDDIITASQWDNLRLDLLRVRQHQTGVDETGNLTDVTTSTVVAEAIRQQYGQVATLGVTNKFTCHPTQGTVEVVQTKTRTTSWDDYVRHYVQVTFASANQARYYFNAGGEFRFTASRSGGTTTGASGTLNAVFTNILNEMGTVTMNHGSTTSSGQTPKILEGGGFFNLTTDYQLVYRKRVNNPYYSYTYGSIALTYYSIEAKLDSTGAIITFKITFQSDSASATTLVDGNLTSTVQSFRPTGTNVSISKPSSVQTGL